MAIWRKNLTIQVRDLETGIVTSKPTLAIADDASVAEEIAAALKPPPQWHLMPGQVLRQP